MATDVAVRASGDSFPPQQAGLVTETLVRELQGRSRDLTELVDAVRRGPLRAVGIPAEKIIHWRRDEPHSWELVLEWLTLMDVEIDVS
jgi:hypothetical protein